jgi:hypothetical protein
MNQRIGRVSRIGQQSGCVNVINLVAKHSIEERILTGIQIKTDLFKGVFDDGPDAVEFSREKRNELLNRLREMMGEDPADLPGTPLESEEIPEDTPHFLNPEVLGREPDDPVSAERDEPVKLSETADPDGLSEDDLSETDEADEPLPDQAVQKTPVKDRMDAEDRVAAAVSQTESDPDNFMAGQSPERIETVLNSGMAFISGLMEMATGQKVHATDAGDKMVRINRETGEVTMSFKLPGWG